MNYETLKSLFFIIVYNKVKLEVNPISVESIMEF